MCDLSECALDRHFQSQLRVMGDTYTNNISRTDYVISHGWLQLFQRVGKPDKYARNCLMLLMYAQLRETGRLGRPFTIAQNMCRPLDDVLNEYDGNMEEAEQQCGAVSDPETNVSSYGGGSSRLCPTPRQAGGSEASTQTKPNEREEEVQLQRQAQDNAQLLKEIDTLHTRTLENELKYKVAGLSYQNKTVANPIDLSKERSKALALKVWRSTMDAIERLKDWTGANDHMDFLATSFQHFTADEPQLQAQLPALDRKFELMLDNMVEQACERREKNVRMLYDQLFQQQQDAQRLKDEQLQSEQEALVLERQQLQSHVKELKRREQLLWQHEAASQRWAVEQSRQQSSGVGKAAQEQRQCGGNGGTSGAIGGNCGGCGGLGCGGNRWGPPYNAQQAAPACYYARQQPIYDPKTGQAAGSCCAHCQTDEQPQSHLQAAPPAGQSIVQLKKHFYEKRASNYGNEAELKDFMDFEQEFKEMSAKW